MHISRSEIQRRLSDAQETAREYSVMLYERNGIGATEDIDDLIKLRRKELAKVAFWARELTRGDATYGKLSITPKGSDYLTAQGVICDMEAYFRNKPQVRPFDHLPKPPSRIQTVKYDGDAEC